MRTAALLIGALALASASCSAVERFGRSAPGLSPGAWRLGVSAGGIGESSDINGVKEDYSSWAVDLGEVFGPSGEFGLRLASAQFDVSGTDEVTVGPYVRWYFPGLGGLRPVGEISGGVSDLDYGSAGGTGWTIGVGVGAIWVIGERIGLEALLRQSYGGFDNGDSADVTEVTVGVSLFW